MTVKKDPQLHTTLDGGGPGAHLRKAREEADMSVAQVAAALLLHHRTVEALEADAYDRLPAPTFVRGYLRGYARVLGLPSGPILEMYDLQGFDPPPLSPEATEATQAHTSDTAVRLVTYAVAAVLVLLVGLWWHSQQDDGFGIDDDLFDWLPDTDREPPSASAEGSGTTSADGGVDGDAIATATGEAGADGHAPAGVETAGDAGTTTPPGSSAPPREDGASVTARTEDTAAGDAGADEPAGVEAAGDAGATTPPGSSAPSREDGTGVAARTEDTAAGDGASVRAAPAGNEVGGESAATAARQPGDTSRDEGSPPITPIGEAPASGDTAAIDPAPSEATVPAAVPDREAPAAGESRPEAASGEDTAAGADPGTVAERTAGPDPDAGRGSDGAGDASPAGESTDPSLPVPASPASGTAATTTDTGPAPVTSPETAQSGLVLEFVHESWVEVYDRERTRLFFSMVRPGRVLAFEGPRPFDVLLGFAKDVRVAIDGQAFDYTPWIRAGVARFSVGSAPAVTVSPAEPSGPQGRDP